MQVENHSASGQRLHIGFAEKTFVRFFSCGGNGCCDSAEQGSRAGMAGGARNLALSVRAAQHLGDLTAQVHIDALWRAKGNPGEARWMLNRLAAELRTTRKLLEATQNPDWWDTATADDIANMYQLGTTWSRDHPDIALLKGG